ncbi:hypothetical protein JNM05_12925 [bacterium]|nr:hypothetical protein [bacterium]
MISSNETYVYNYMGVEASRNDGGAVLGLGIIHYISKHFVIQFQTDLIFRIGLFRSSSYERSIKDGVRLRGGLGYAF